MLFEENNDEQITVNAKQIAVQCDAPAVAPLLVAIVGCINSNCLETEVDEQNEL
jgi:hypothetical protein